MNVKKRFVCGDTVKSVPPNKHYLIYYEKIKARYQPSELLVDGFEAVPLTLDSSSEFVTISSSDGKRLKSSINGFVTEFSQGETVISVANARNLLFVEELTQKPEDVNWEEKFKTHKGDKN